MTLYSALCEFFKVKCVYFCEAEEENDDVQLSWLCRDGGGGGCWTVRTTIMFTPFYTQYTKAQCISSSRTSTPTEN